MIKSLAENRRAFYDFEIKKKIEAGIKLTGGEVKSIKGGKAVLTGSFVKILGKEVYVIGMNVAPYPPAARKDYNPRRTRKLLLKKREIEHLAGFLGRKGLGAVPLRLYLKDSLVKLEIGVGRGRKRHTRRAELREQSVRREVERSLKNR